MSTPFLFFEFDASLFQKYYGSGINTPGIYAIPEDETEPSAPPQEMEQMYNEMPNSAAGQKDDENMLSQREENKEKIDSALISQPDIPLPQMSADEQQAYEQEIQPIKKAFLLNKLKTLQKKLNDNSMSDDDLNLVLKYGPYLTYSTLVRLAVTAVNNLRRLAQMQSGGQQEEISPAAENQMNMAPMQGADVNVATQFV